MEPRVLKAVAAVVVRADQAAQEIMALQILLSLVVLVVRAMREAAALEEQHPAVWAQMALS
jgi:hypothetical protein